jgi:multidrug efflux pump subunit AcrA (membrane-fusion protein)
METKSKNISLKAILIIIAVGIWGIFLQNAGIIPTKQNVYVKGGYIDAEVSGSVDVNGRVEVDNTIDVNIHEINGHNQVTTRAGTHSVFPYGYMLPVDNW